MKPEQKEALLVQSDARHPERLADGAEYADGQRPADMRATLSVLALKRTLAKAAHAPTDRELIASPREFHGSRPTATTVNGSHSRRNQPTSMNLLPPSAASRSVAMSRVEFEEARSPLFVASCGFRAVLMPARDDLKFLAVPDCVEAA